MSETRLETKWFGRGRTMLIIMADHFTLHLYRREVQILVDGFTFADYEPGYEKPRVAPWEKDRFVLVSCGGAGDGKWGTIEIGPVFFDLSDSEVSQWTEVLSERLREPIDHKARVRENRELRDVLRSAKLSRLTDKGGRT
jgi:hypothetical protein